MKDVTDMGDLDHLFEKIAAGEIPSHKVYEDENVFAFLDINPASRGHTLIIPKKRWEFVHEMPAEVAAAIGAVLPRIAKAVIQAVGASAYNIINNNGRSAGQVVPHVHFHIIPKLDEGTEGGSGLSHTWSPRPLNDDEAKDVLGKIREALA